MFKNEFGVVHDKFAMRHFSWTDKIWTKNKFLDESMVLPDPYG